MKNNISNFLSFVVFLVSFYSVKYGINHFYSEYTVNLAIQESEKELKYLSLIKIHDEKFYNNMISEIKTHAKKAAKKSTNDKAASVAFGAKLMSEYLATKKKDLQNLSPNSIRIIFENMINIWGFAFKNLDSEDCYKLVGMGDYSAAMSLGLSPIINNAVYDLLNEIYKHDRNISSVKSNNFTNDFQKSFLKYLEKNPIQSNSFINGEDDKDSYCKNMVQLGNDWNNMKGNDGEVLRRFMVLALYEALD